MAYHVVDVLPRCWRIMEIGHEGIGNELFLNESEARYIVDAMMAEALQYRRKRKNKGSRVRVYHNSSL